MQPALPTAGVADNAGPSRASRVLVPGGSLVALKRIHPWYARSPRFRARFRHEAEHARRVPQSCTAEVLEVCHEADPPYLVTEYVDGRSLAAAVCRRRSPTASTVDGMTLIVDTPAPPRDALPLALSCPRIAARWAPPESPWP